MVVGDPKPNKSLGQHWLKDETTLNYICDLAGVSENDTVLEVGPGTGYLTSKLSQRAKKVCAVEFDKDLADQLKKEKRLPNVEIINQDILKFNLTKLPSGYKVVANIPYYLTSKLLRVLSESANPPILAVLLIQKEVAQRIAAEPGQMSLLSVSAQYYWEVALGAEVAAELFSPPPKVDSQVVLLTRRKQPLFPDCADKTYFRAVKAGFSARRKTILNSLSGGLRLSKQETSILLDSAGVDASERAQNLTMEQWKDIACNLNLDDPANPS